MTYDGKTSKKYGYIFVFKIRIEKDSKVKLNLTNELYRYCKICFCSKRG